MQIRFHCPSETCVAIIEYEPFEQSGDTMRCPRCGVEHDMHITDKIRHEQRVDRCAVCNGAELFVRKDFPQLFGFAVVLIFGAVALYFFSIDVRIAWGVLAAALLIDLGVYTVVGKVTTCYACRAEYRKCPLDPAHEGFDLSTSEKY